MSAKRGMLFTIITIAVATMYSQPGETAAPPKTQIYVASMVIDGTNIIDGQPPRVLPNGSPWYRDYRWPPNAGDPDPCVEGYLPSTGAVFMRLNRRIQPQDVLCHTIEGDAAARQYTLIIDDAEACDRLVGSYSSLPCSFTTPYAAQQPFVEPGPVFKNKVTRTVVTFYFRNDMGTPYRVTTDADANVIPVPGNPNSKIVQYSGRVTLAEGLPTGYVPFTSFSLPFRMQFDRTLVPTP